jgi:hypothetical protein
MTSKTQPNNTHNSRHKNNIPPPPKKKIKIKDKNKTMNTKEKVKHKKLFVSIFPIGQHFVCRLWHPKTLAN